MTQVFIGEDGFGKVYAPVYAERGIGDGDTSVGFGMIIVVTLILEDGYVGKHGKTVSEPARDKELAMVVLGEFDGDMLTISWGTGAKVDCDVEY